MEQRQKVSAEELEISFEEMMSKPQAENVWIFENSDFLPLTCFYEKSIKNFKTTTGKEIPVHVFRNESADTHFLLSAWNKKAVYPLPLIKDCPVKIYVNAQKKLEILRLNP